MENEDETIKEIIDVLSEADLGRSFVLSKGDKFYRYDSWEEKFIQGRFNDEGEWEDLH